MSSCDICLSFGRTTRIRTKKIKICQNCITEISNKVEITPDVLYLQIKTNIEEYYDYSEPFAPVQIKPIQPQIKDYREQATHRIKNKESLAQSLLRMFFDDSQRQIEISHEQKKLYREAIKLHKERLTNYHTIEDNHKRKLEEYYRKKTSVINKQLHESISTIMKYPLEKDDFFPYSHLNKAEQKIIRATQHQLIDKHGDVHQRPALEDSQITRSIILNRDNHTCSDCHISDQHIEYHVHHIIPLEKGGTNHHNNLATLCYSCHNRQHKGFRVTRTKPIRRPRTGGVFFAVDIETTGFSKKDEIIEIAAIKFQKGKPTATAFNTLVKPKQPITDKISKITGITNQLLENKPPIEIVISCFLDVIEDHKLVFHNAPFDLRFLKAAANREISNKIEDTLKISRKKLPHLHNHKLLTISRYLDKPEPSHRAYQDALATGKIYIALLNTKQKK